MTNTAEVQMKPVSELIARKGNEVTGNYYLAECGACGEMFTSERMTGGQAIADTGDYGDCYCPHCDTDDSEIIDCGAVNSAVVEAWNFQQKHIDALIAALEQAKSETKEFRHRLRNEQALLESADKRIDELENDEVRQRLANAEHQLHMAELAKHNLKASRRVQFKKRRAAERRVAELEASKLSVKLQKRSVGEVMHVSGFSRDYAEGWCAGNDNAIHEIRAAGGTVEGSD